METSNIISEPSYNTDEWIWLSGGWLSKKTKEFHPHPQKVQVQQQLSNSPVLPTLACVSIYSFFCDLEEQEPDVL